MNYITATHAHWEGQADNQQGLRITTTEGWIEFRGKPGIQIPGIDFSKTWHEGNRRVVEHRTLSEIRALYGRDFDIVTPQIVSVQVNVDVTAAIKKGIAVDDVIAVISVDLTLLSERQRSLIAARYCIQERGRSVLQRLCKRIKTNATLGITVSELAQDAVMAAIEEDEAEHLTHLKELEEDRARIIALQQAEAEAEENSKNALLDRYLLDIKECPNIFINYHEGFLKRPIPGVKENARSIDSLPEPERKMAWEYVAMMRSGL